MENIITPEERRSPLAKFLDIPIAETPADVAAQIMQGGFDPAGALHPSDMNRLFDDGYLPGEFGWWILPDGGLEVANLTPMPGVTTEMFDWWFAWHGLNALRYKIWDKDDHFYVQTQNVEQALDESLSLRERFWNTTHVIRETFMSGEEPREAHLHFVPPVTIGIDPERYASFGGTIICTPGPAIMCHFLRPTPDGSELRTRFWMGYDTSKGYPERIPGFPAFDMAGKALLMHNVKEFTHLAKILPQVYAEFKDDFTVAPFDRNGGKA